MSDQTESKDLEAVIIMSTGLIHLTQFKWHSCSDELSVSRKKRARFCEHENSFTNVHRMSFQATLGLIRSVAWAFFPPQVS